jgi:hypothetical protein
MRRLPYYNTSTEHTVHITVARGWLRWPIASSSLAADSANRLKDLECVSAAVTEKRLSNAIAGETGFTT